MPIVVAHWGSFITDCVKFIKITTSLLSTQNKLTIIYFSQWFNHTSINAVYTVSTLLL